MKVKDVMTNPALYVNQDSSIVDVSKMMQEHNIGALPVCDNAGAVLGIITDRDIVTRTIASNKDYNTVKACDIMTRDVKTITPTTDVDDAFEIMSEVQIRRLPVVEGNVLVGMVSIGDMAISDDFGFETADALCEISKPAKKKDSGGCGSSNNR